MFSFDFESPLPISGTETYRGMAFDGCQYYLTIHCACAIAVLDRNFGLAKKIPTRRPYTAICYDSKRDCFWAISDQCRSALFQLNPCLQEIDRFIPRLAGHCPGPLTSISFCCEGGALLAACGNQLLEIDTRSGSVGLLREEPKGTLFLSVACLSPYLLFYTLRGCAARLILASCDGTPLKERTALDGMAINSILLDSCEHASGKQGLLLLANKHHCYPCLLHAHLDDEIAGALHPCNWALSCNEGTSCHTPCACADVLESIALEEAALAHILNAEGEKLQKVIAESSVLCELLLVNESVQRTLISVTQLEQTLLSKLKALQPICGFCEKTVPPEMSNPPH